MPCLWGGPQPSTISRFKPVPSFRMVSWSYRLGKVVFLSSRFLATPVFSAIPFAPPGKVIHTTIFLKLVRMICERRNFLERFMPFVERHSPINFLSHWAKRLFPVPLPQPRPRTDRMALSCLERLLQLAPETKFRDLLLESCALPSDLLESFTPIIGEGREKGTYPCINITVLTKPNPILRHSLKNSAPGYRRTVNEGLGTSPGLSLWHFNEQESALSPLFMGIFAPTTFSFPKTGFLSLIGRSPLGAWDPLI